MDTNIILATDSYKLGHWRQYPKDTQAVYSYFESRGGAEYPYTVFFGLHYILKEYLEGVVVTGNAIEQAASLASTHFGNPDLFNRAGWEHILEKHHGRLPLRIKAVAEGTVVPTGNVLMTVENTDPECFWLTNAVESLLTHVWFPSTVATLSRATKEVLALYLDRTAGSRDGLDFMLHDFGYRGTSSHESAAIGGAGHLVNFMGTDTLSAMLLAESYYQANPLALAFSVPATEHSVMTALGERHEFDIVDQLLEDHPTGILSVVADSYDIYRFVDTVGTRFRNRILDRDGVFVVRPDSVTHDHPSPGTLVADLLERLWKAFGGTTNAKGFRVLDPHVRLLWGDGIDLHGIEKILGRAQLAGFSAENLVFGMGGGLLQKMNRDTQRFAFKSSAQKRGGVWHDVYKKPLDTSKASKRGRLGLIKGFSGYSTFPEHALTMRDNLLRTVFENGRVFDGPTFDEIRERAALPERAVELAA